MKTVFASPRCDQSTRGLLTINSGAVIHNIRTLQAKLPNGGRLLPIVKAGGYGICDASLMQILAKEAAIDFFGVAHLEEAVQLKSAGIGEEILVLHLDPWQAEEAVFHRITAAVGSAAVIQALGHEAALQEEVTLLHLHIDTGMNRYGCKPCDAVTLAHEIADHPFLRLEGAMTHFSSAENPDADGWTRRQAELFDSTLAALSDHGFRPRWRHTSNSGGLARFGFSAYNMARPGIALYGLASSEAVKEAMPLKCAVTLSSHITDIRTVGADEPVSYGGYYRTMNEETIATIPLGYHDGILRSFSNRGSVIIKGMRAPIVGMVCMDFLLVNVTGIEGAALGDSALFFGYDSEGRFRAPEDFAGEAEVNIYELISRLGPRIRRNIQE